MAKKLAELLQSIPDNKVYGDITVEVENISDDSRKVNKGDLFVAIKGQTVDAHTLIPDVIKAGAASVVGEVEPEKEWLKKITYIKVVNSRKALALIASEWYENPSRKLKVIGVTGTKGKTTVSFLIYWILKNSGVKVGLVSSVSAVIGEKELDTGFHVTNPEPLALQSFLSEMVKENCEYAVLEVTSHGLDQDRVAGIDFEAAVLTNITHEHLDYHKTYENYREAKTKLFKNVKIAVLNSDDSSFEYVKSNVPGYTELISYGLKNIPDYKLEKVRISDTMSFDVSVGLDKYSFTTNYLGEYNAMNILAASATARKFGVDFESVRKAIEKAPQLPGHLEQVKNDKGISIFIDFAHTPDSLEQVLKLLRSQTKGKLIAVFGCASERDTLKRPMMGEISAKLANVSIFTAEDPRFEDINKILDEIAKGASKAKAKEVEIFATTSTTIKEKKETRSLFYKVPERGEAIALAIQKIAQKGDTLVICGKGHEKSMAYEGVEHPWSDREEVEFSLKADPKKVVILLAAGRGKRMNSDYPKVLHKIAGRPMISYTLENARKAGFGNIIVVVGYKKSLVMQAVEGRVKFAYQSKLLGTADAAAKGLALIGDGIKNVIVMNGDDSAFYYPDTINKVLAAHIKNRAVITFVSLTREDPTGLGRLIRDKRGRLLDIVEEKDANEAQKKITEVNDGLYILDVNWTKENLPNAKKHQSGEYYIVDLVKMAIEEERHVEVYKLKNSEEWLGVSTREDLAVADTSKKEILQEK